MKRGNLEGSIYQRESDGRFVAAYKGADGRRHALYGWTRSEVRERLVVALRDAQQGIEPTPARVTVATFLERWLASAESTIRPATFQSYRSIVRHHLVPAIGATTLAKLRPEDVDTMLRAESVAGKSPRTVALVRAVLRRALGQGLKWGLVARNVATLVDPPKQVRHEIEPLGPEECRQFLAYVADDRLSGIFVVALATGLRQGELLGLRWSDVDLKAGTVAVRRAYGRTVSGLGFVEPKTSRSRRTLNLPVMAVSALTDHRVRQLEERLRAGQAWVDQDLVFATEIGTPLDPSNLTHRFQRLLAGAGIARRRFHDLRHSAATLLLVQGVSPRVVQEILGHSSVTLTLGTYSHVLPALKRDAADRMDEILGSVI